MWSPHTVEYYSALTKNEILIHMLQRRRISRTSRRVKEASYSAHMRFLDNSVDTRVLDQSNPQRQKAEGCLPWELGRGLRSCFLTGVAFQLGRQKCLEMLPRGDGCTTTRIDFVSLSCVLKSGPKAQFILMYIFTVIKMTLKGNFDSIPQPIKCILKPLRRSTILLGQGMIRSGVQVVALSSSLIL